LTRKTPNPRTLAVIIARHLLPPLAAIEAYEKLEEVTRKS
jgi:cobalamin biosynthesis Mg chelatase CobN